MTGGGRPARSGRGGGTPGRRGRVSTLVVALLVLVSTTGAVGATAGAGVASVDAGVTSSVRHAAVGAGGGVAPLAQQDNATGSLAICDREASRFVSALNGGVENVPAFVRARLSDSNVHLVVNGEGGGDYTMVTNDDSQVTAASEGEPSSASVRVITDCRTFRNITDASDPGDRFQTAYANDRIRFVGVGTVNWLFFSAVETATDPLSLGVVLFLFLILLVVAYILVRRVTSHFRGGPGGGSGAAAADRDDGGGGGGGGG